MRAAKAGAVTISMAKLTSKERKALPTSEFAEPAKRKYPINDKNHAKNALARVAQNGTPAEKKEIESKVKSKFPTIGKSKRRSISDGYMKK